MDRPPRDDAGQQTWKPIFLLVIVLAVVLGTGLFFLLRGLLGAVLG